VLEQDAEQLPDTDDFAQPSSPDLPVTAPHGCAFCIGSRVYETKLPDRFV